MLYRHRGGEYSTYRMVRTGDMLYIGGDSRDNGCYSMCRGAVECLGDRGQSFRGTGRARWEVLEKTRLLQQAKVELIEVGQRELVVGFSWVLWTFSARKRCV